MSRLKSTAYRTAVVTSRLLARPAAPLRTLPDYLIIGAQRCGTTTLQNLLLEHPGVLGARLTKGVHWFDVAYEKPLGWYRSHFPFERTRARVSERLGYRVLTGEGSPYYLFHPYAPARIRDQLPDVKLIAVLRSPVERAWSAYHHERRRGFENLDPDKAFAAEESRLAGQAAQLSAPAGRSYHHLHHAYVARGRYFEQLARVWASFPPEQLLVLFSADLERDPAGTLASVHSFLGLPVQAPVTARRWNEQRKAELPAHLHEQLTKAFAEPDWLLAERLGGPLPWSNTR